MATFTKKYDVKGVLLLSDMQIVETKKEGIFIHDLESALRNFEGQEIAISVTYKEEVEPSVDGVDAEG